MISYSLLSLCEGHVFTEYTAIGLHRAACIVPADVFSASFVLPLLSQLQGSRAQLSSSSGGSLTLSSSRAFLLFSALASFLPRMWPQVLFLWMWLEESRAPVNPATWRILLQWWLCLGLRWVPPHNPQLQIHGGDAFHRTNIHRNVCYSNPPIASLCSLQFFHVKWLFYLNALNAHLCMQRCGNKYLAVQIQLKPLFFTYIFVFFSYLSEFLHASIFVWSTFGGSTECIRK